MRPRSSRASPRARRSRGPRSPGGAPGPAARRPVPAIDLAGPVVQNAEQRSEIVGRLQDIMIKRFHSLYVGQVETLGGPLPDTDANRAIFEEGLELLLKCFNEESFQHKGRYFNAPPAVPYRGYELKEITCVPRPKHLPVEIWMPIASGRTIDLMTKYGLKAMVTLNGEKILDDVVGAFHAACVRHGRPSQLGQDMIWGAGVYLADTREVAIRRLEPSHDERYKWFAPFGFVRYADEQGRTWGTPGASARVPSLRDGVEQKAWFCGPPSQVIEGIKSIEAKYPGLEDFMIHWAEGLPPSEFIEQLRWFAKDVMPAFNRA